MQVERQFLKVKQRLASKGQGVCRLSHGFSGLRGFHGGFGTAAPLPWSPRRESDS